MESRIHSDGRSLNVVLTAAGTVGDIVAGPDGCGRLNEDGEIGDLRSVTAGGVIHGDKTTGQAWVLFDAVYYDATNDRFTTTASGNTKAGLVAAAALSADTSGLVLLNAG